jgi:hypothetical protein
VVEEAKATSTTDPRLAVVHPPCATCSVAGQSVDTGGATGGLVYSQMGQFTAKPDTPKAALTPDGATSNAKYAVTDPKTSAPVSNPARNVWITETALSTALNTSYMATQLSLFSLVVGIALVLAGIGFAVLALGGTRRQDGA